MSELDPRAGSLLVAVGGATGAVSRWVVGEFVVGPLGTMAANVVGSFLLAVVATRGLPEPTRLLAATGFCSSFTTYSAFAVETVSLGMSGIGYLLGTYAFGVAAATLGVVVTRGDA